MKDRNYDQLNLRLRRTITNKFIEGIPPKRRARVRDLALASKDFEKQMEPVIQFLTHFQDTAATEATEAERIRQQSIAKKAETPVS
jgi:hypothetical protein